MSKDVILGVARHALTFAAGALVSSGYLAASDADALVGGLLAIAGVAWSIYVKVKN